MFPKYLESVYRHFLKNRKFVLLNILGLAVGLSGFILIMAYVIDEYSHDGFHTRSERTYRLYDALRTGTTALTPIPWGPALKQRFPEIEDYVRVRIFNEVSFRTGGEIQRTDRVIAADSSFFEVFSFPLIAGDRKNVLRDQSGIVVTDEFARRNFPGRNALGERIEVSIFGMYVPFIVSGVVQKPARSHLTFDLIIPFQVLKVAGDPFPHTDRMLHTSHTYLVLKEGMPPDAIEEKLPEFVEEFVGETYSERYRPALQRLEDIYLRADLQLDFEPRGNRSHLNIFIATALIVLISACINFMNLSSAQSLLRAKEVGIRKVLGASRPQLILRYLTESVAIAFASLLFALIIIDIALPYFNELTGKSFTFSSLLAGRMLPLILGSTFITGVLAGCYPAVALSSFKPATVLKTGSPLSLSGGRIRKTLLIVQFASAGILVILTGTIYLQLRYIETREMGFERENILALPGYPRLPEWQSRYEDLKRKLLSHPGIESISGASSVPGSMHHNIMRYVPEGYPEGTDISIATIFANADFLETFRIELISGNGFTSGDNPDSLEGIIVNEAAAASFAKANPEWADPVDRELSAGFADYIVNRGRVVGVMKDFNFEPLYHEIVPLVLRMDPLRMYSVQVRLSRGDHGASIARIRNVWNEVFPEIPFDYRFLDESIRDIYGKEFRLMTFFEIFAALGIFIASLGVYGLSAFMTRNRLKEVSVRKILGASPASLMRLISNEFLALILLSGLIAVPVAVKLIHFWLDKFVYNTGVAGWLFIFAPAVLILITLITVSIHSFGMRRINPVDVLREE